jgi:putative tricarboxylic transport membrane protein
VSPGRWAPGITLLALAAAVALEARTFTVGFPTDPLGPAAFPLVAAALLAVGGLAVLMEKSEEPEELEAGALRRLTLASVSFVLYALLLAPLGFLPATTLEFGALAVLFGGRPVASLVAGLGFAALLFVVFVYGLGLPLPLGIMGR